MEEILLLPKGLGQKQQDIELPDFREKMDENGGIPLKKCMEY
jgi:hypothetical protein